MLVSTILPFLGYWLILYVACYILLEFAQNYLYDEVTPGMPWKVAAGTLIFAVLLTIFRTSFETLFMPEPHWSALQALVWFAVFVFVFRFHILHAAGISLIAFVVLSGAATLAINSMSGVNPGGPPANRAPSKPIRRSLGPALPPTTESKATETPAEKPAG